MAAEEATASLEFLQILGSSRISSAELRFEVLFSAMGEIFLDFLEAARVAAAVVD